MPDPANIPDQPPQSSDPQRKTEGRISWLVIGMGSMAYGKERRAVTAFKHAALVHPHFLTTIWEDGSIANLLRENGFTFTPVTIGYLGRARLRWTLTNLWHMPKLLWNVLRIYRAQRCRGVVALSLIPFVNVLPSLLVLRIFTGARFVFYLGDIPSDTFPNRVVGRIMNWTADAIIVNSEAVGRGVAKIGVAPARIRVLYNGLELERFRDARPFPWREEFGWTPEVLVVGYAGQFAPNKGVMDFIEAAETVLSRGDRCRFVLVGKIDENNPCYCELVDRISKRELKRKIVFCGWVRDMERAYAAFNLAVVPSRHEEPAANVIIEALASGVPVIATRTGGSPELLDDGATGFLVEKQSPEQIAEKIELLDEDRSLLKQFGANARAYARERFNAEKIGRQLQATLLEVLNQD